MSLSKIKKELKSLANKKDAQILQYFFKTEKGNYGEGDMFLGIRVPVQRRIIKKYLDLSLSDVQLLLESKIHEYRFSALLILIKKFELGDEKLKKQIYKLYLQNIKYINNWDLVDLSAPKIIGVYLFWHSSQKKLLVKLANSKDLWSRRISILASFYFIQQGQYQDTLKIAKILLKDEHDLIHKAVGWMLREVGKRIDQKIEEDFLKEHYQTMPRVMLRYALEKFTNSKRKKYLKK